jgi:ParB family chromosome partitioning protein
MATKKKAEGSSKKKTAKAGAKKKKATRGKRKPQEASSAGLSPDEVATDPETVPEDVGKLAYAVTADDGAVLARYRDPLFGHWVILAALPLEKVKPTPYQRDVSEAHVDRLVDAIQRTGLYLDPIICVRSADGVYLTPNGGHRLASLTRMGAKTITALLLPDEKLAFKILALNVEKAHALKERSLEVIRMVRELVKLGGQEKDYAAELEEPSYITLGACYEEKARFAGSAYNPVLKRVDAFLDLPMADALVERERRAAKLLAVEEQVGRVIKELKAKGFDNPYLRNFVVARINPLRFAKRGATADFDETIDKMLAKATDFDLGKVKAEDVSKAGGAPGGD